MITKDTLKKLLAENKTEECFEQLFRQLEIARKLEKQKAEQLYNNLIILKGQYAENEQDRSLGFINTDEYRRQKSKIKQSLITFINNFPKDFFELQKATTIRAKASLRELISIDDKRKKFDWDVFVSFSHKNKDLVREIANFLRGYGLKVFIYYERIAENAGHNFWIKINKALETSRHFVLIATPESLMSDTVETEYTTFYGQIHKKDKNNRRFIIYEGTNFSEDLLPVIYRNLDRVNKPDDLLTGLIDIKYLNKRYEHEKEKERQKLIQQIKDLEQQVSYLQDELKKANAKIDYSFELIENAKKTGYNQAKKEIEQLQKELNETKQQLEQAKSNASGQKDALVISLQKELDEKQNTIKSLKDKIEKLQQSEADAKKQLAELQTKLNAEKTGYNQAKKELNETKQQLEQAKSNASGQKNALVISLQKELDEKQNTIKSLKDKIEKLQQSEADAKKQLAELQTKLEATVKELNETKKNPTNSDTELIKNLQKDLDEKQRLIDDFKKNINDNEIKIKELKNKTQKLTNENKNLQNKLTDKELQIEKLKDKSGQTKTNKLWIITTVIFALISVILFFVNTNPSSSTGNKEAELWENTVKHGSFEQYQNFLEQYPAGKYTNAAIDSLFSLALKKKDLKKIEFLINTYPDNQKTNKAKNQLKNIVKEKYNKAKQDFYIGKDSLENNFNYDYAAQMFKNSMQTLKSIENYAKYLDNDPEKLLDSIDTYVNSKIQACKNDMELDPDNKNIYEHRIKIMSEIQKN